MLKVLRLVVLVLATLTVGMKFAHVLELGPKLRLEPDIYLVVQTTLYQLFGSLGPIIDIGTVILAAFLAYRVYRQPAFRFTSAAVIAMIASLAVWALLVAPANMPVNEWQASGVMPEDWMRWRDQWQYGQVLSFSFDLLGYCLLLWSVIRETPTSNVTAQG